MKNKIKQVALIATSLLFISFPVLAQTSECRGQENSFDLNGVFLPNYAQILDIPFDHSVFVPFIQMPDNAVYCFAQQYFPVEFYKISAPYSTTTDSTEGITKNIDFVPEKLLHFWLDNIIPQTILRGLTTINYTTLPTEKINEAFIFLRTDGNRWHLWHEFSHLIILNETSISDLHHLPDYDRAYLFKLKQELDSKKGIFTLQDFKTLDDYLKQIFESVLRDAIEEVFIESNLVYLLTQNKLAVRPTQRELNDSIVHIKKYDLVINNQIKKIKSLILNFKLVAQHNTEVETKISEYKKNILFIQNQSNIMTKKSKEYKKNYIHKP